MRTISTDTQTRISASGQDPYFLLRLTLGTTVLHYADRDTSVSGFVVDGRIMSHGDLTASVRVDSAARIFGTFSVMGFTLSDNDEVLRGYLNSQVLQGSVARVYYVYEGQTLDEATLLLEGTIESPPSWDEEDRSLSFEVETKRRDEQVPFAAEASDNLPVDEEAEGRVWPMVFGDSVKDAPATLVKSAPQSRLVEKIDQTATTFTVEDADEDFPQGEEITLKVGDEYMTGSFSGETFTVTERQVDRERNISVSGTAEQITVPAGVRAVGAYIQVADKNFDTTPAPRVLVTGYCWKQIGRVCYIWNGSSAYTVPSNAVGRVNRYPFAIRDGAQWEHTPGTSVTQIASNQVVFVANELGASEVIRVRAYRQIVAEDGEASRRALVTVPESAYTVTLSSAAYNGATIITMDEPLSARGAGWEDTLYVSQVSSVGSNPADIIKWLIDNRSSLTADAASFAEVRTHLLYDPMNFWLSSQDDVLDAASEIAWQARSGLVWTGDSVKMRYLAARPSSTSLHLTDDTVLEDGIVESRTDITDVVTVMRGLWKRNGAEEDDRKYVAESNISLYGRREEEFRIFCYQKRALVKRCIDFWSARRSNIWRTYNVGAWGSEALGIDPLDWVQWSATGFYASVPSLVTRSYVGRETSGCEILTPVKAGETTESSDFFLTDPTSGPTHPANIPTGDADIEVIEVPPPVILAPPEFKQEVYEVVAVSNEVSTASLSNFKEVRVRIVGADEQEAAAAKAANAGRIAEIDTLDPTGVNGTLQTERDDLVEENFGHQETIDYEEDNSEIVTAYNQSVSFMLAGDTGTMIKVPGGRYVVTAANATGPFVAVVDQKPASPAKGKLYSNVLATVQGGPTDQKDIVVLGDPTGIEVGDKLLVFRDSDGTYYTSAPAGASGSSVFRGSIVERITGSTYSCDLTLSDGSTLNVTVNILQIDATSTIPAGTALLVLQVGSSYYGQVPVWL